MRVYRGDHGDGVAEVPGRGPSTDKIGILALWSDRRLGEEFDARLRGHESVTIDSAADIDELAEMISRRPVDCIVCAESDTDGRLLALGEIVDRAAGRAPVIFLTSDKRQDTAIKAFRLGAGDCVAMSDTCDSDLIEAIHRLKARAERLSASDPGTQRELLDTGDATETLLPPEQLMRKLDEISIRSGESGGGPGILAIEIADIGYFASKFGSRTIDELSREFARRLSLALQGVGYFCRRPDATFVVILNYVSGSAALEIIVSRISNELSFTARLSDLDFRIESVIGACDGRTAEEALALIETADKSLEKALAKGRRYHIAGGDLYGTALQRSAVRGNGRKANRRAGERKRIHKYGRLVLAHLNATVECIVLDVSETGARLRINGSLVVPEEFELILPYATEPRRVKVRWRRQKEFGVEFVGPQPGRNRRLAP